MANVTESKDYIYVEQGCSAEGVKSNNNKEWHAALYDNGDVEVSWGRVGSTLASKVHHGAGASKYGSLCRSKETKGYTVADVISTSSVKASKVGQSELSVVAKTQIKTNSPEASKLIDLLIRENRHTIMKSTTMAYNESTGLFSTPMGLVSISTIGQARDLLGELSFYVKSKDYNHPEFMKEVCKYLRYIPQEIPRQGITTGWLFPDMDAVVKQNDILDALEASLQTAFTPVNDSSNAPVVQEKVFDAKIFVVEDGKVYDRINRKYNDTRGKHLCAHLKLAKVYEIEIAHMNREFDGHGSRVGNINEFWHGTKTSNLLSILKNGFIIPKSNSGVVNGAMFGIGAYFSDTSTKSLNYAYGYWDGSRNNLCYMLVCDVAMGKSYRPARYGESLPKPGFDSTDVKANSAGVQNHEAIVYNTNQIKPKYLCEFKG